MTKVRPNLKIWKRLCASLIMISFVSACTLSPIEEAALKPPLAQPVKENFEVYEVKRGSLSKQIISRANVVSSKLENLFFKESGARLRSMNVSLGDMVQVGDVVAELDQGDLATRIRLQELNVEKAQIALEQVRQDSIGNTATLRLRMIDVEAAQIQLGLLQQQLEKTKLVSQTAGIVTYMDPIREGEVVAAYKTLLTIADPYQVQLLYENVNTSDLMGIVVGMDVKVKFESNVEVVGKVLQTPATSPFTDNKAQADRNARTIVIGVDNLQEQAKIGGSATITIETEKADNVLVLPRVGLRSYLGREYVQILDGESRKEIDVEKGIQTSTEVEIRKGLQEGQKVILNN